MKRRSESRTFHDLPAHLRRGTAPNDQDARRQWNADRRSWCEANGVSLLMLMMEERKQHHLERFGDGAA